MLLGGNLNWEGLFGFRVGPVEGVLNVTAAVSNVMALEFQVHRCGGVVFDYTVGEVNNAGLVNHDAARLQVFVFSRSIEPAAVFHLDVNRGVVRAGLDINFAPNMVGVLAKVSGSVVGGGILVKSNSDVLNVTADNGEAPGDVLVQVHLVDRGLLVERQGGVDMAVAEVGALLVDLVRDGAGGQGRDFGAG